MGKQGLFSFFKEKISPVIGGNAWQIRVALICVAYCILISMPNYSNFYTPRLAKSNSYAMLIENYQTINDQIDHPFHHNQAGQTSHASKLDFRFVPALLAMVVPSHNLLARMLGLYIINNIAGFIFFMAIIRLVFDYSGNRLLATLVAFNFAVLYIGKSFFHDTLLWNDGIAFMFLMCALGSRHFLLVAACLLLAFFTDERAIFGGLLVFVYRNLASETPGNSGKLTVKPAVPFLLAYSLYLIIRLYLKWSSGLVVPLGGDSGVSLFLRFKKGFPVWISFAGALLAYKSAWIFIALSAWWLRTRKLNLLLYLFGLISILVISVSVQDLTRSLAYGFVALLTGFLLFYRQLHEKQREKMEHIVFTIFIINLCIPTVQITYIRDFKIFPPLYKLIWPELHSI